jgi:hypothetical protein
MGKKLQKKAAGRTKLREELAGFTPSELKFLKMVAAEGASKAGCNIRKNTVRKKSEAVAAKAARILEPPPAKKATIATKSVKGKKDPNKPKGALSSCESPTAASAVTAFPDSR